MQKILKIFTTLALMLPVLALAHGPSRVKVVEQIEINASPEKVWALISDYCSIKEWNPVITDCVADNGSQEQSIRTLSLENGEKFREQLVKYQADQQQYTYMLMEPNPAAFPINTHGSTISVKAGENGGSIVEWKGAFYRLYKGMDPPPDQKDEVGKAALTRIYQSGLQNLKALAEK